jgi:6,7-dimethyl-8-ribityllumazine synthase
VDEVIEATLVDGGGDYAIVVARFNELVTARLVDGARAGFRRHGVGPDRLTVVWVPGAFELPLACLKLATSGRYVGIVALGAVVRGETPHFDHVAGAASSGVAEVTRRTGVPVAFGVLTTETMEQALDRAGGKLGNAGSRAAEVAIEMVNLLRDLG